MKKVLFLTGYASPYKVSFFDCLAQYLDVTVLLSEKKEHMKHRDASWFIEGSGKAKFVELEQKFFGGKIICPGVISWLKNDFDTIVICGYSKLTDLLALAYLKCNHIPYVMEVDGGLIRRDGWLQKAVKTWAVRGAALYLSSGKPTTEYLVHYGAQESRVRKYPFASWFEADLPRAIPSFDERKACRAELNMSEDKIVLSIGQFIPRKGFDVLLQAAQGLPENVGVYIVGSEPTQEYISLREELKLTNVHFMGFQNKQQLAKYYTASDLFVLPTREDIWGLVINEAMAFGLPVVTTDRCVAGMELIREGVNGYIVPVDDAGALRDAIVRTLAGDMSAMGRASFDAISGYTIENMASVHAEILKAY